MPNDNPSIDPAYNDSLAGTIAFCFKKLMQGIAGVMPARVLSFQSGPPDYVRVQPLVQIMGTSLSSQPRGQVAQIPVCQIGAGGYLLRFNLKEGDQGLMIACDRDISLMMQGGVEAPPNTDRVKDFADSFFLPVTMRGYTVASEDAENAVLQNSDGSIRIALWPDKIKMTGNVEINGDLLVDGDLTVDGRSYLTGRTIVYGDINSGGNITAVGSITPGTPIPP